MTRACADILAEIEGLLPIEKRLKELRIELGKAKSRDHMIAMRQDQDMEARRRAGLAVAMQGNANGKGAVKSPEVRSRIAAKMAGNKNCVGRTGVRAATARSRGIEIVPSPVPGLVGLCPDYRVDRVVFYAAAAA